MINESYRPWGEIDWLINRFDVGSFDLINCLSTEDRCLFAFEYLKNKSLLGNLYTFDIDDPSETDTHSILKSKNKEKIAEEYQTYIEKYRLLEPPIRFLLAIDEFIAKSDGNVILDISSLPKRFFFPLVKRVIKNSSVKNFLVVCTSPLEYTKDSLSEDPQEYAPLPSFINVDPDKKFDLVIVGVGFMPLGLPQLLKDQVNRPDVRFIFPFPPGPPTYQRTWSFVNEMRSSYAIDTRNMIRVNSVDVSSVYNEIVNLSDKHTSNILFAPYGPKNFSLAMCLYSCFHNSTVYYSQPTKYDPYYSRGVSDCYAYLVIRDQENLYKP